ncbi:5-methylthioadenosine/S-adenosylhomocysteine deaminase [Azorhizobium oxalatiphilum]|uniref:5-methylthioadenosine/S-adenosylhomocysteine deaminase n=1 Tax=Azorhizobium oxalatiphilum TaxID=980631 RepID=A0A917FF32_9HYPH|nr:amidohydrolase family protein [Azorhizobium oxalatiphilum]GGF77833.1 5-methylthioadenosine/S-adenosylhomocysteine deaminase [Azorhizobium oxalatiphilum]
MTAPIPCDLLVRARAALVLDVEGTVLSDIAIAVTDGRIVRIGPAAEVEAAHAPARTVGSSHHLAMPGLVNTHNHTPIMVVRGMIEDVGFAPAYTPGVPQGDMIGEEETYLLARLGLYEMLRFGSTTVVDFYRHPKALARAAEEIGLRSFVGGRIMDADTAALARREWKANPAAGERTLAEAMEVVTTYAGRPGLITPVLGPHAPDTCSPGLLRQVAEIADKDGIILHTHLHQSPMEVEIVAARDGKRPVELMDEVGLLGPRLIAGHCIHMSEADMALFGARKGVVAHVPVGNAAHGSVAHTRALEQAGARITIATDTKSGDMFEAMRMAIAGTRIRGCGFTVSSHDVLRWATHDGAASLGLAGEVGVLKEGAKADIVLLDTNAPNLAPLLDGPGLVVHSANGGNVDTVVVDGRVLLEGGRPTLFDGDEVIRSAQAVSRRLWEQAGRTPAIRA